MYSTCLVRSLERQFILSQKAFNLNFMELLLFIKLKSFCVKKIHLLAVIFYPTVWDKRYLFVSESIHQFYIG